MLEQAVKERIQQAYRNFLEGRDLKPRYGQKQMIAGIANFLAGIERDAENKRQGALAVQVVEAGTGTGKTLAYALAAVPLAAALEKKLVIATATVALQEQVLYRDLPDIVEHAGLEMRVALAKGRRRYVCQSRLDFFLRGAAKETQALYPDEADAQPGATAMAVYQSLSDGLAAGEWNGDRDDWKAQLDDADWYPVTADQSQCSGRRCAFFKECSFFKARDSLGWADVIVANHDLVLADLSLGGGAILPPPEDCIYVFDEAHHLPDKTLGHFSYRFRVNSMLRWLEQTQKAAAVVQAQGDFPACLSGPADVLQLLLRAAAEVLVQVKPQLDAEMRSVDIGDSAVKRYVDGIVPADIQLSAGEMYAAFNAFLGQAEQCSDRLQKAIDDGDCLADAARREQWLVFFNTVVSRSRGATALWQSWSVDAAAETPPRARWMSLQESQTSAGDIELCSSPVLAGDTLQESLWDRAFAVILTSATLSALGNYSRFNMRTGLDESRANYLTVPSPFPFAEAAELVVPGMDCDPRNAAAHTLAMIKLLPEIFDREAGNLVLFSSRRQMEEVLAEMPADLKEFILAQGSHSKQELLRRHRQQVDAGGFSVLFGLASFSEGVDLPGDYCRHVIIAKIPFSVPNDPVEEALAEWVERNNGKPFMEISVPDAALRLIQASGRLMRNETDGGRISILDRRLVTSFYGKRILDSLPPYRRVIE